MLTADLDGGRLVAERQILKVLNLEALSDPRSPSCISLNQTRCKAPVCRSTCRRRAHHVRNPIAPSSQHNSYNKHSRCMRVLQSSQSYEGKSVHSLSFADPPQFSQNPLLKGHSLYENGRVFTSFYKTRLPHPLSCLRRSTLSTLSASCPHPSRTATFSMSPPVHHVAPLRICHVAARSSRRTLRKLWR
jgi:hypothetical protein